jgi:hypothetical protein
MYKKKTASTKKFNADLEWGTYWEWETISFIEKYFNDYLIPLRKKLQFSNENLSKNIQGLKEWDMKYAILDIISNKPIKYITFEIKADRFDKTGNLIFEKKCSNKLSGLFATKADYFVYYLPRYQEDNFYICKPDTLMDLIEDKFASCLNFGGGDNKKVISYLVNKQTFDEEYTAIKSCKLLTCDLEIPAKYNVTKFKEEKKYTYYGAELRKYTDPFNFK